MALSLMVDKMPSTKAEEIVAKLRQVEVLTAQGKRRRGDPIDRGDGVMIRKPRTIQRHSVALISVLHGRLVSQSCCHLITTILLRPGSPRRLNDGLQIGIFGLEPEETLRP